MGSRNRRALAAVVGAGACLATGLALRPADATGYENADYLTHELDNLTRSIGPGSRQLTAAHRSRPAPDVRRERHGGVVVERGHPGRRPSGRPGLRHPRRADPWWERRRSPHLRRHAGHAGRLRVTHRCGLARPALVGRPARSASRHRDHERVDPVAGGRLPLGGTVPRRRRLPRAHVGPAGSGRVRDLRALARRSDPHVRGLPVPAGPQLRRWHGGRAALPPLDAARPLRTGHLDRRRRRRPPGRCRGCRPRLGQPALVGARRRPPRHRRPQPGRGRGVDRAAVQRPLDSMAGGPDLWRALVPDPRRRRLGSVGQWRRHRAGRPGHGPGGRRLLHHAAADVRGPRPVVARDRPRSVGCRRRRHLQHHVPRRHPLRVELDPGDLRRHRLRPHHRRLLHARLVRPVVAPRPGPPGGGRPGVARRARARRAHRRRSTSGRGGPTSCRSASAPPTPASACPAVRPCRSATSAPLRACHPWATGPAPTPTCPRRANPESARPYQGSMPGRFLPARGAA